MMKLAMATIAGLVLAVGAQAGQARPTASGHGALALAALVGSYAPHRPGSHKAELAALLDGKIGTVASTPAIDVTADTVSCRAGDVDITAFACELTFGSDKVALTGRRANELFATMAEAGVRAEGAAGTIHEALHAMHCVVDPAAIAQKEGGGASCRFKPGPGA